jgi:hypothetical protein
VREVVLTTTAFDRHVEQLFDILNRLAAALRQAGIEYRVIGGVATFIHVSERDPLLARMTRDVDLAIDRDCLQALAEAVRPFGFEYRHAAGVDMLVDTAQPKVRSSVHLVFVGEKVRADYPEPVPDFSPPVRTAEGLLVASVADLVRMKLTSFRENDRVHVRDMDSVGLITAEIEGQLSDLFRQRLVQVRATE